MRFIRLFFAICLLAAPTAVATTIGPPVRITCPHCGEIKYISSIISGNTFGGKFWSDTRYITPMLPSPSAIQHCPHCDGYFFYDEAEKAIVRTDDESIREEVRQNQFGDLSFAQMDEAYSFLGAMELTETQNAVRLREWLLAFNDVFSARNAEERQSVSNELAVRFAEVVAAMLVNEKIPDVLKAELCRETGLFDECIAIARKIVLDDGDEALVARQIVKHAMANDSEVFLINPSDEND